MLNGVDIERKCEARWLTTGHQGQVVAEDSDLEQGKACGTSPWMRLPGGRQPVTAKAGVAVECRSRGRMNREIWTLCHHPRFSSGLS